MSQHASRNVGAEPVEAKPAERLPDPRDPAPDLKDHVVGVYSNQLAEGIDGSLRPLVHGLLVDETPDRARRHVEFAGLAVPTPLVGGTFAERGGALLPAPMG